MRLRDYVPLTILYLLLSQLLSLILIPFAVLLRLFLEVKFRFLGHPLPEKADLLHYLGGVPVRVLSLEVLPLLLAEEDVWRERPAGSLVSIY
jgi:hypothetical protein